MVHCLLIFVYKSTDLHQQGCIFVSVIVVKLTSQVTNEIIDIVCADENIEQALEGPPPPREKRDGVIQHILECENGNGMKIIT